MIEKIPFWKRGNVLGGLILIFAGLLLPVALGGLFPALWTLLEANYTLAVGAYKMSIFTVTTLGGLIWLLWPKIREPVMMIVSNFFGRGNPPPEAPK